MKEVNILQQLTGCPYVITLFGLCTTPGHYAIVMEYIEGQNLHELLIYEQEQHPALDILDNRLAMGLEIAEGMKFLHCQEPAIIHRDLKSANILVDTHYHCKVSYLSLTETVLPSIFK